MTATSSQIDRWPDDAGHAADHAALADGDAAREAHARGHRRVRADVAVVSDLDLVIELHALFEHGVADGAAVDGGVAADLHIRPEDHAAHLRDREPATRVVREPKPSAPITAPGWSTARAPTCT